MEIDDTLGYELHDRTTRGLPLIAEEQAQLQAWYDQWERLEMAQWGLTLEQQAEEERQLAELQAQVAEAEAKLAEVLTHNRKVAAQNEALRTEIRARRQPPAEAQRVAA